MSNLELGLNAVILAVTDEDPRIITVRAPHGAGRPALPYGPLDTASHKTLERAVRGWVREQAGLELGYVEQLYTFGDRLRSGDARVRGVAVAYLALVRESPLSGHWEAQWEPCYSFFPWEDWRAGGCQPSLVAERIVPELLAWVGRADMPSERARRRERVEIAFGLGDAGWNVNRVLERYELLYEADLVAEADHDRHTPQTPPPRPHHPTIDGQAMVLDHRQS
ncbi:MAG: hypothetical protein AAFX99_09800 [Myxococcota bacterium]